jgi:anthranilate phosphoribosyltransferase
LVTGSGGVAFRIPNVSTAAGLTASCVDGVLVVKPGSQGSRSKQLGPGGLARRLGLPIATSGQMLLRELEAERFAIVDTDQIYPWLQQIELLTVPFFADALGQSSVQPCDAAWKVNGVVNPDPSLHLERCRGSQIPRTLIVHGHTDVPELVIDDVSTSGTTVLLAIEEGSYRRDCVEPEQVGVPRRRASDLRVPDSRTPESVFVSIVDGDAPKAWVELVAFSAAVILLHACASETLSEGYAHARDLLITGVVAAKLRRLQNRK